MEFVLITKIIIGFCLSISATLINLIKSEYSDFREPERKILFIILLTSGISFTIASVIDLFFYFFYKG